MVNDPSDGLEGVLRNGDAPELNVIFFLNSKFHLPTIL